MTRLLSITILFVGAIPAFSQEPKKEPPKEPAAVHSIEAIRRAWTARQERFASFEIQFQAKVEYPIESISFSGDARFCFDGSARGKVRARLDFPDRGLTTHELHDGDVRYRLLIPPAKNPPEDALPFPQMTIRPGSRPAFHFVSTAPHEFFRPFDDDGTVFDITLLKLDKERDTVAGRSCVVARTRIWHVWLDPERDYIPLRIVQADAGESFRCADLNYRNDPKLGFVPSQWKDSFLPYFQVEARVTKISAKPAEDAFKIIPPLGTRIDDGVQKTRLLVLPKGPAIVSEVEYNSYDLEAYKSIVAKESPNK